MATPKRAPARRKPAPKKKDLIRARKFGRKISRQEFLMPTGRPAYHPSVLLKLYIYGYLNRVQSSRRLEREAGRNVEVMWLTGRLAPDHKTIADFRKDNGGAIRQVCARFVALCRAMGLFDAGQRGDRRQQVQGGEQPRQELHARQDGAAHGADRGERRALSAAARHRRPAGAVRGAQNQDEPSEREDREAEGADAASRDVSRCRCSPPRTSRYR